MRIDTCLNTTLREISAKKFNIWFGISLGNKYFNREHMEDYLKWAVSNTKEKILIIVADEPQAINYQVFEGKNEESAKAKALKNGAEIETMLQRIISEFPEANINIARWADINKFDQYFDRLNVIKKEFSENPEFHKSIRKIVEINIENRIKKLNDEQKEKLCQYVLEELPIFFDCAKFEGDYYGLHVYPGLSFMDDFILGIQNGKLFPELCEKLKISRQLAIIEAYAE